jgi:hypothetical protein
MPSANQSASTWSSTVQGVRRDRGFLPSLFRVTSVWSGLLAFVLILLIACGAGGDEILEQSFQVGDLPRLVVGADNGSVLVETGPEGTISVLSVISNKDDVDLSVTADGDVVTVRSATTISGNLIGDRAEGAVDFTITVPPDTVIEIGTAVGPITVKGVRAGGTITDGAGSIELRGVSGEYSGGVGAGDIRVVDGDGSFRFTTGVGSIMFDGVMVSGGSNEFETGVGDVTMTFPEGGGVEIAAATSTGMISNDLILTDELSETSSVGASISGTLGDGGADLRIVVGVGSLKFSAKAN